MPRSTSVSRAEHRRVGITLDNNTKFGHILTLGAVADGGITVSAGCPPPQGWHLTHGTFNPRFGRASRGDLTPVPKARGLKLHYHSSGITSIKSGGNGPEVRVTLPRLETLHARQIFSFTQTRPDELGWQAKKGRDDGVFNMLEDDIFAALDHNVWPSSVSVAGTIFKHSAFPWLADDFAAYPGARAILRGRQHYTAIDLRGHGIDSFLVVDFSGSDELSDAAGVTSLVGMCTSGTSVSPFVAATASDGAFALGVQPRHLMPQFPANERDRVPRPHQRRRTPGGPGAWVS